MVMTQVPKYSICSKTYVKQICKKYSTAEQTTACKKKKKLKVSPRHTIKTCRLILHSDNASQ